MKNVFLKEIGKIPAHLSLWLIRLYQKTVSPDHGIFKHLFPYGFCRYNPSCSEYTAKAIMRYGFFKGIFKGMGRILRCNPCSKGGIDFP